MFACDPTSADASCIGGNVAMNAGGKKAVLWGTALDNLASWRMVTPDARMARGRARSTTTSARSTTSRVARFRIRRLRRPTARRRSARPRSSRSRAPRFRKAGLGKDVTDKFLGGLAGRAEGRLRRHHHVGDASSCTACRKHVRTVCLEFFGHVREAVPSIVEIKDYLDAQPGGAMLAGLEHLDERYVKAVGYATKARAAGPPEDGADRRHRRRRRGRGRARPPRTSCASPTRAAAKASSPCRAGHAQEVLARPRAHRRDLEAHQRLQDQRGRGDPARRASATTPTASSASTSSSRSRNKLKLVDALEALLRGELPLTRREESDRRTSCSATASSTRSS